MKTPISGLAHKLAAATALSAAALAALASPLKDDAPPTPSLWQEHKGSVTYFGITSVYSCTGIESKVRQVLLLLGARKDMSVNASGCNGHDMPMGPAMTVNIRVFSLAPAGSTAVTPGAAPPVMASYSPVAIDGQRPPFMGEGDCELIDQLHEFITKNFSSQNVDYHASCTPHQNNSASFAVRGEFLKTASS
jgi:hypothetical protein